MTTMETALCFVRRAGNRLRELVRRRRGMAKLREARGYSVPMLALTMAPTADVTPEDDGWTPRGQVIDFLRCCGYKGRGFDALTRDAYREAATLAYWRAEDACNGQLLNRAAYQHGVDPESLFMGPEHRARKWASEELLRHWQDVGRLSYAQYVADLLEDASAVRCTTFA
jgi:hypothetical protein